MTRDITAATYLYERWRAVAGGILETAGQTFLLLAAVRALEAGPTAKALLASGGSVGFLLSIFLVAAAGRRAWRPARAAAWLSAAGGVAMAACAALPWLPLYTACAMFAMAAVGAMTPLLTQIYEDNYPVRERGRLFARSVMIRVLAAAAFSEAAGRWLARDFGAYRGLLAVYALAFGFGAFCLLRTPSRPLRPGGGTHPLRALRFVREDRRFRITLICWMLMGFSNLMTVPLRVEYLANPRYALDLDPRTIAFMVGVVPNLMRLVMSPVWGWLFDRMNFFVLRVILNLGFAVSIVTFFTSDSFAGLLTGAVVFGVACAGGDVAWTLWVTKFAPSDRVADYMSVHTFFTGLRGVAAPLVAFHLAAGLSLGTIGFLSAGLILAASLLLVREIRIERAGAEGVRQCAQP